MKKGFQLLKTKNEANSIEDYGVELPEKYRLFIDTFNVGDNSLFSQEYFDNNYNQKRTLLLSFYEPMEDICFVGFNTIQDSIDLKEDIEEYQTSRFLPVGYSSYNAGIVVSLEGDDKDVVYFDDPNSDDLVRLCDDIFEFVKGLELRFDKKIDVSKLYKNWGEDFWRVKEDLI